MAGRRERLAVGETEDDPAAEAAMLRAGLAGDRMALGRLLALHKRSLVRFCLGILGNLEDAEDAAQETFLRALHGLATFRGDAAFRTWLFRIAVNICLRWKAVRRDTEPWNDERQVPPAGPFTPEALALRRLRLIEALDHLPPHRRAVFLLKEWEGWSVVEIAGAMGWNPTRVKNELSKARHTLAEWRRQNAVEGEE
jgi:RNA polymerase sigma factor (sigma-70 family)